MISIEQFRSAELKVAKVVQAVLHSNADRLLVLTVDIGGTQKEIVAGVARHYTPAELIGKLVVVVDNLEPATIRGVVSSGMVLVAQDGERFALLTPDRPLAPGAAVS